MVIIIIVVVVVVVVQMIALCVLTQFERNILPPSSQMTDLLPGRHSSNSVNPEVRCSTFLQNTVVSP
jgi:hypothetical protein